MKQPSLLILYAATALGLFDGAAAESKTWNIYHELVGVNSLGSHQRGEATLAIIEDTPDLEITVKNTHELSSDWINNLNSSTLYQIRMTEVGSDKPSVITTVPTCMLRRANFRDEFVLTLNSAGDLISLSYIPLVSPLAPPNCDEMALPESPIKFESKISYETAVPGMVLKPVLPAYKPPPGLNYLSAGTKRSGATKTPPPLLDDMANEQSQQDQGMFGMMKRYWYLWLPLLLMNLMASPQQPPIEEAEAGSSGAPSDAAAKQASPSKRRGKRG